MQCIEWEVTTLSFIKLRTNFTWGGVSQIARPPQMSGKSIKPSDR